MTNKMMVHSVDGVSTLVGWEGDEIHSDRYGIQVGAIYFRRFKEDCVELVELPDGVEVDESDYNVMHWLDFDQILTDLETEEVDPE